MALLLGQPGRTRIWLRWHGPRGSVIRDSPFVAGGGSARRSHELKLDCPAKNTSRNDFILWKVMVWPVNFYFYDSRF